MFVPPFHGRISVNDDTVPQNNNISPVEFPPEVSAVETHKKGFVSSKNMSKIASIKQKLQLTKRPLGNRKRHKTIHRPHKQNGSQFFGY